MQGKACLSRASQGMHHCNTLSWSPKAPYQCVCYGYRMQSSLARMVVTMMEIVVRGMMKA